MKEHILSLSYGKDSIAAIGAIQELGWPLERIVHVEVWATESIPAELPPMVAFKDKADAVIEKMTGIRVERIRAKESYESIFYRPYKSGKWKGLRYGFPMMRGAWCNSLLKCDLLDSVTRKAVTYIGIAADEPQRFHNLTPAKLSPLVEAGWTEAMCREWCEAHGLLSPIYTGASRGGCWFCHNQGVDQLRKLRKDYPEYWELLLKWDSDTLRTFKPNGHSVHDYERRFSMEDAGQLTPDDRSFRWKLISETG